MGQLIEQLIVPPSYSNFPLTCKNRMSMAPSYAYPVYFRDLLPGQVVPMEIENLLKSHRLLAPVMGSMKLQYDMFWVPWSAYTPEIRDNEITWSSGSDAIANVPFPYISVLDILSETSPAGTINIQSSSLCDFIGLSPGTFIGDTTTTVSPNEFTSFQAFRWLGYIDAFLNYYCNLQQPEFYFASGVAANVPEINRSHTLDQLRSAIRMIKRGETKNFLDAVLSSGFSPTTARQLLGFGNKQSGLLCTTYLPDRFHAWVDSNGYGSMQQTSRVTTTGNFFTNDQLIYSEKFTRYLQKNLFSGSRTKDFIRAHYGVVSRDDIQIPQWLGSTDSNLDFEEFVSTAGTPQDGLASRGGTSLGYGKGQRHQFMATTWGTYMIIARLTPRVDYRTGIDRHLWNTSLSDVYYPEFDQIGMQDMLLGEIDSSRYAAYPTTARSQFWGTGVAKQPSWTHYRATENRLHGDFTNTLDYWTLCDDFTGFNPQEGEVTFPNAYIDPRKFNYIFADTSQNAENFQLQTRFHTVQKLPMSKAMNPTLF